MKTTAIFIFRQRFFKYIGRIIMKRTVFLLLIAVFGFTSNDVQREFISLEWEKVDKPAFSAAENIGLTFNNAVIPDSDDLLPVYSRQFNLPAAEYDFKFVIENPVFEEMTDAPGLSSALFKNVSHELLIEKNRYKSGSNYSVEIQIKPYIRKDEKILLLKEFELKKIPVRLKSLKSEPYNWKSESVLSSGKWYKISTTGKGIYKIPYSKLSEWGFSDPSQVRIFGAGGKILPEEPADIPYDDLPQLNVWHNQNNGEDCIFFFAPGTTEWNPDSNEEFFTHRSNNYSKKGYFFLTTDKGTNKTVEATGVPGNDPTHTLTAFDAYGFYENEIYNLLHSGKQWFGEKFIHGSTRNITFQLPHPAESSFISVRVNAAARSSAASEMTLSANQTNLGTIDFYRVNTSDPTAVYADEREARFSFPSPAEENAGFTVNYFGSASNSEAWLDFIEVNYRRKLRVDDEVLFFRDLASVGNENIAAFTIESASASLKVWDVTDAFEVKEIPVEMEGTQATCKVDAAELREYAAFGTDGNFPEPKLVGEVENQNLHGLQTPEFLIISHPDFIQSATALANFHRAYDGMQVEVVASDKVYNEFSSGMKSATGIRNFIKMFYDRNNGIKYVLLFGDGSYDNKNLNDGSHNFIPTFQSGNSLNPVGSFVTDDFFVILDDGESVYDGAVDLGIGRLPASTTYQAELMLGKIQDYYSPEALGNWRNVVCFIADDEDGNLHMSDSERLAGIVNNKHKEFITDKIYFDAYQQVTGPGGENYPGVTEAINNRVKDGVLVLNYVGHANERFMADEKVLDVSHINSWSNSKTLPIFVTATCEFSRFDSDETSAGEYVLLNPSGGGIGLFSTTRLVFAYSNFLLSRSFYNFVFEKDENGEHYRMGDIMRLAKVNTINTTNKRNFSLLADPALKLSYPKYKVETQTINGTDAAGIADTVGALQKVTVTGFIADEFGNKLDNFSGELIPTVYDKSVTMQTLGNGGENPMEFEVQENIIYKGLTQVSNGEFNFSFVVPKDISYSLGEGKILYYAQSGETDAHGAFENFFIGGPGSQVSDNQGPEIQLYLNSPEFQNGDKVSKNPTLLARLSDENGINTVGTGIGHDITAVLDDEYSNVMVLNNYYQADPGEYNSGTVHYPLRNLSVGKHTLKLKAWDVANNSTEVEIAFEVSGDFVISNVTNYPNPVYDYTFFTFEHNQSDATLETIFEIFDQNGRRVDYFSSEVGSDGTSSNPVRWDLNELRLQLRSGIYIYKITAQNNDGVITSHSGKMLIGR